MSSDEVDISFLEEEDEIDISFLDEKNEVDISTKDEIDISFLDEKDEVDISFLDESAKKPEEDKLSLGQTAGSLAIDVGGSIGSQALGYSLAPFTFGGSFLIPFFGGVASSITAQMTAEGKDLDEISYGRALSSGLINLLPGASVTKFARPIAREAAKGAAIGAGDVVVQSVVDEKRLPTK